ncbi:hypothetical protein [Nocardioides sp.]|uniref:hypothetical protein n=1 Tax=Nocardioides sp. TaxID=35761 RepID=UPI00262FD0CB|nr:hypothetical protein [Nocardioides sp.]
MTGFSKVLLGLALGLPMGAYAVGSMVSSAADDPGRRAPIILEDAPTPAQDTVPGPTLRPSPEPTRGGDDDGDDGPGDDGPGDDGPGDDEVRNRPEVVVPSYADRDDDDDDDRGERDDTTDDRDDD